MMDMTAKRLRNLFLVPIGMLSLSACVYGDQYGSQAGYSDDQYCDPYNEYDAYYGCDVEYGFANIGYGGGWYQDYYYPGYGFFIFNSGGQRYRMNDHYRSYWGGQRHSYFRGRFTNQRFSGNRLRNVPFDRRGRASNGRANNRNVRNDQGSDRRDRVRRDDNVGRSNRGTSGNRRRGVRQSQSGQTQPGQAQSTQTQSNNAGTTNGESTNGTPTRAQRGQRQTPPTRQQRAEPRSDTKSKPQPSKPARTRKSRPAKRPNGAIRGSSRNRDVAIP